MTTAHTQSGAQDTLPIQGSGVSWDRVVEQAFVFLWAPLMSEARTRGDTYCMIECGDEFCENARAFQEAALRFFARQLIPHYAMFVHEKTFKRRVVHVAL